MKNTYVDSCSNATHQHILDGHRCAQGFDCPVEEASRRLKFIERLSGPSISIIPITWAPLHTWDATQHAGSENSLCVTGVQGAQSGVSASLLCGLWCIVFPRFSQATVAVALNTSPDRLKTVDAFFR